MKINNALQLKQAIADLEAEEKAKKVMVVDQFHEIYDSLKPANLVRSAFHKFTDAPGMAKKIIGASVGVGVGLLSKKLLIGGSTNIFKRAFGSLLQLAVASTIAKNADGITQKGADLIKKIKN